MSYNNKQSFGLSCVFAFILCLPFFVQVGVGVYSDIVYNINCGGYLKRAADANTIDTARNELAKALKYLEDNKMTEGYTSIIYNTPSTDVGFWYNNLKSSKEELDRVTSATTQLERSNILMKLRETLLDHAENGDIVTAPDCISIFPNNRMYFISGCWSLLLLCIGIGNIVFRCAMDMY